MLNKNNNLSNIVNDRTGPMSVSVCVCLWICVIANLYFFRIYLQNGQEKTNSHTKCTIFRPHFIAMQNDLFECTLKTALK